MRINILEMHSSLGYAGGQRNMVTFVKYLRKDIFNVSVIAYRSGGPLEQKLTEMGVPYLVTNGEIDKIINFIKENKIDVIHIHRSGGHVPLETQILSEAKKYNPDLIVIEKNVFGKYDPTMTGIMDCSFLQSMMHLNERYLPASKGNFNSHKQKVLYNMVDKDEFDVYKASNEEIVNYKKNLGIEPDDFVIGKVGRPALEKWSDLIIEMAPFLLKDNLKIKIIIIGCPPSRVRCIEKSKYKKSFCLIPETSDQHQLHLFYQAIDVLAHSSKIGECNGNTINEAMFWSKPVIVNSTPKKDNGQLEQVIHMKSGIVANTPITVAKAILYLYNNPQEYRKISQAAHEQVLVMNKPHSITAQIEKFLIEKLGNKGDAESLSFANEYAKIEYDPNENDILNYRKDYALRLRWDFGNLSFLEKINLLALWPHRFYFRVRDFIAHKWLSYAK